MLKVDNLSNLKFIVASTGRCGSVYIAKLLTSVGVPCSHECIFSYRGFDRYNTRNSIVSTRENLESITFPSAESSLFSVPYLELIPNIKVVHLVREPLKVIKSFAYDLDIFNESGQNNLTREFLVKNYPELQSFSTNLEKTCRYYIACNTFIEKCSKEKMIYRVEDEPYELFNFLGIKSSIFFLREKKCNSFSKRHEKISKNLNWNDLPNSSYKDDLINMAINYGYF